MSNEFINSTSGGVSMNKMAANAMASKLGLVFVTLAILSPFGCGRAARSSSVSKAYDAASASAFDKGEKPELVVQYRRDIRPGHVAFADRAPLLIACGTNGPIDVWDTRTWTLVRSIAVPALTEAYMNTKPAAISPDGSVVAYVDSKGQVTLWDVKSGALSKTLPQPVGMPVAVVFSPNGAYVAGGGTAVRVWSVDTGKVVRSFQASGDVAFSRDSRLLAVAEPSTDHRNPRAYLFDVTTGRRIRTFHDSSGLDTPVAISPDNKLIATGGEDPYWDPGPMPKDEEGHTYAPSEAFYAHTLKIKIWDARTGRRLRMFEGHSNEDGTRVLQFTSDGRGIFDGGMGHADLWDLRTGKPRRTFETWGAAAVSPDGKTVAVAERGLKVLSAATGLPIFTPNAKPAPVVALAFSADGKTLAAADEDLYTGLRLWDTGTGRLLKAFNGPSPEIQGVSFLPGGRVMSGGLHGTYIWDVAAGKLIKDWGDRAGLVTPDGKLLVTQSGPAAHRVFSVLDATTGRLLRKFTAPGCSLSDAVFSPDGRYLATTPEEWRQQGEPLVVVDLLTGTTEHKPHALDGGAWPAAFSADGTCVAACVAKPPTGLPTEIALMWWDRKSGKELHRVVLPNTEGPWGLAFSGDAGTLAVVCSSQLILYGVQNANKIGSIDFDPPWVKAMAFSPDGSKIALAAPDGGWVRLWDVKQRRLLLTMVGLPNASGSRVSQDWYACTPYGHCDWSPAAASRLGWSYKEKTYPLAEFEKQLRRSNLLSRKEEQ